MTTLGLTSCTGGSASGQAPRGAQAQAGYQQVIRKLLPSVVEISTKTSTGSGVVFDTRGDIVTNEHVVVGATTFKVRASDLSKPLRARLVGMFAPDDLAVIQVDHDASQLRPARFASTAAARAGEIVLAMGSPYGLTGSVTQGIISATGRVIRVRGAKDSPPAIIVNAIQTSAAINPGNSGGALILLSGQVIGIPTLSATDPKLGSPAPGIGFAIPSGTVVAIARQLVTTGKVTRSGRASMGISGQTVDNSAGAPTGIAVDGLSATGAAARAGIRYGDVIAGINGRLTPTISDFERALSSFRPGQKVTVEILRSGNPRQFTVTLGTLRR